MYLLLKNKKETKTKIPYASPSFYNICINTWQQKVKEQNAYVAGDIRQPLPPQITVWREWIQLQGK